MIKDYKFKLNTGDEYETAVEAKITGKLKVILANVNRANYSLCVFIKESGLAILNETNVPHSNIYVPVCVNYYNSSTDSYDSKGDWVLNDIVLIKLHGVKKLIGEVIMRVDE